MQRSPHLLYLRYEHYPSLKLLYPRAAPRNQGVLLLLKLVASSKADYVSNLDSTYSTAPAATTADLDDSQSLAVRSM